MSQGNRMRRPLTSIERRQIEHNHAQSLRTFEVTLKDNTTETVIAHHHDCTNPAGHLLFVTMSLDSEGEARTLVHDGYNFGEWKRVKEVGRPFDRTAPVH